MGVAQPGVLYPVPGQAVAIARLSNQVPQSQPHKKNRTGYRQLGRPPRIGYRISQVGTWFTFSKPTNAMTLASLIRIAFSRMLDGYGMGIITRNGYPIQKWNCFTG